MRSVSTNQWSTTDAKADTFNLLVVVIVIVVVIELTSFTHELLTQFRVGLDGCIEAYHGRNQGKEGKSSAEHFHLRILVVPIIFCLLYFSLSK